MFYLTFNRAKRSYQITFDDILNGVDERMLVPQKDTKDTTTLCMETIPYKYRAGTSYADMYRVILNFNKKYKALIETEDKSKLYRSFKIPKRSGGLRQIDAPNDDLMKALRELKDILEHHFYATYHTAAFSYIQGRSTIDAVRRHQMNKSRWFFKTDMSKFFPSTTFEFLTSMLYKTFPMCVFVETQKYKEELDRALSLCFLNGGLPQGTPTSPMLTNMMMIPIDYEMSKWCHEHVPHLCYSRYADDVLISSEFNFTWSEVQNKFIKILEGFEAPFRLNNEKTRYGSSAGRNWNLGVMLNKDNNITIGHEKKKVAKAMIFQFMNDYNRGTPWTLNDTQHLMGILSYYNMVEPEFVKNLLLTYNKKFNTDVMSKVKEIIRQ